MSASESDFASPRGRKKTAVTRFVAGEVRAPRGTGKRLPTKRKRRKNGMKAEKPSERVVRKLSRERTAKLATKMSKERRKVSRVRVRS